MRPCKNKHPNPKDTTATCRLCYLALNDPRYARLWGEGPPTGDRGYGLRVKYCAARKCWDWTVMRDGLVVDSGSEPTASEAKIVGRQTLQEIVDGNV